MNRGSQPGRDKKAGFFRLPDKEGSWLIFRSQIGIDRSLFLWRLSLQLVLGDILLFVVLFHLPPVFQLLGNFTAGPNPSQDGFPLDPGQIEPREFIFFIQQPRPGVVASDSSGSAGSISTGCQNNCSCKMAQDLGGKIFRVNFPIIFQCAQIRKSANSLNSSNSFCRI